jgi:hypothetical protein
MKIIVYVLAVASILAFVACDDTPPAQQPPNAKPMHERKDVN